MDEINQVVNLIHDLPCSIALLVVIILLLRRLP